MSAWSHLPNARHIDWVVESVKTHPELWRMAYGATRNTAYQLALNTVYDAMRVAGREENWSAAMLPTRSAAWRAACDANLALIAYDDCDQYLSMSSEELKVWAYLSEKPAAVLLLPMVIVREQLQKNGDSIK